MIPMWPRDLALACLTAGIICAIAIAVDLIRHPRRMWIMNVAGQGMVYSVPY